MQVDYSLDFLVRNVTLRQLQIFKAVVDLNSFTRAAERLHLTQPTVSMQVRKLSEHLGAPLFEHAGNRTRLTQAGERALACAESMFDALEELRMSLADMAGLKRGRLRVSVVTTAEYVAPRILGAFSEAYPGIDIELRLMNRSRLLARIAAHADDLSILGRPPEGLDVAATAFLDNPQEALAAESHPLAGQRDIPLARLAEEPMIMREEGSGTRKAVEDLFRRAGLRPRIRMELGSNEAIKQAVAGGLGVSILSRHTLAGLGRTRHLAVLDVQGFPVPRQWRLVHPRNKELTPAAQAFHDFALARGSAIMAEEQDAAG